ncbi:MAG: hypothetical protein HUJ29_10745 [Gammaproteobacteria bacterium]|nr:hypothetical protein [Gammaproteobacteria bacterium]
MTATARKILNDCRYAHELLELEENERKFKLLWIACSSLLRAVGHALYKVDCRDNNILKTAVETWWNNIKEHKIDHAIFFEFVERERNNVLKEYEIGFFSGEVDVLVQGAGEQFTLAETAFCPMSYGAYEGEDCRDVANMAIEWWDIQLNEIDRLLP